MLADGRELIDGIASWWTACHGYNHPHIRAAVERQTRPHAARDVRRHGPRAGAEVGAAALQASWRRPSLDRVFFSDSGSVAVEVALKMAVQYWRNRGVDGRSRILGFTGAYHGDTTGAMAVSDPEGSFHAAFQGLLPEQITDSPAGRRGE